MQTTDTDPSVQPVTQGHPCLYVLYSAGQVLPEPQTVVLQPGEFPIGREQDAMTGLALRHDRRASRLHAFLTVSADGSQVVVQDRSSKNHTFVNGQAVASQRLADGDVLRIGSSLLLIRYDTQPLMDCDDEGTATLLGGVSRAVRELRHRLVALAPQDLCVLLLGESGVGKELSAKTLHARSGRTGPLVAVNCAAIPTELAESQLFGHQRGAFSGAHSAQPGFFQQASGGTLFLDEIGELPLIVQAKLLRVLEDHVVLPLGATRPVVCPVRVVAATNRNLEHACAAGLFREDLYARLESCIIKLPPLRERREDLLALFRRALPTDAPPMTPRLAEALLLYRWPRNVRELLQVARELKSRLAEVTELDLPLLADRLMPAQPSDDKLRTHADAANVAEVATGSGTASDDELGISRETLSRLLREHDGVIADVARVVGRSRRQVNRWLQHHGLKRKDFMR